MLAGRCTIGYSKGFVKKEGMGFKGKGLTMKRRKGKGPSSAAALGVIDACTVPT